MTRLRMKDIVQTTVGDVVRKWAKLKGDKVAMIIQGKEKDSETTWGELNEAASKFAHSLADIGVQKGEKVGILLPNCKEYFFTYFGNCMYGAVTVPLNPLFKEDDMVPALNVSDTETIVFSNVHKDLILSLVSSAKVPNLKRLIYVGEDSPEYAYSYQKLVNATAVEDHDWGVKPSDVCIIYFTTGTTGLAKAVMHTHFSVLSTALSFGSMMKVDEEARVIIGAALYHSATLGGATMFQTLFGGSWVVATDISPQSQAELVSRTKVTHFTEPVPLWIRILSLPNFSTYDFGAVKTVFSGASIVPDELQRQLMEVFPQAEVIIGYAFTEAGPIGTSIYRKDILRKPGCVGTPWPYVHMAILEDNDQPLGPNQLGEICVRSPSEMLGYYKDSQATSEAFAGGWLHSGDMGVMDEEGYVYIKDRKKDLIIRGGINIPSQEIENKLFDHPKILEAAVFSTPDPILGEEIMACIIPKAGESIKAEEVVDYLIPKLARNKIPRYIQFVDDFPRSVIGKILKRDLRDYYRSRESERGNKLTIS